MIEVTRDGATATILIDRAAARNALSLSGWRALADAAYALATSDARVVLLRSGSEGIFSAGADISEFRSYQGDSDAAGEFRRTMRSAIDAVAALPMPVIAAVDGGCFGAAVALILAADLRVGGQGARFAATPAKLGIGYPREDVAKLMAQVGKGNAARLLFTGEIIDTEEAHRIGLIELEWEDAATLAHVFAQRILANAPGALRLLKRTMRDPGDAALDAAFDAAFSGPEFAEGLAAFGERRRPDFA